MISNKNWRRGRDSNPRYPCEYAAFRVRCFQPLSHLSAGLVRAKPAGRCAVCSQAGVKGQGRMPGTRSRGGLTRRPVPALEIPDRSPDQDHHQNPDDLPQFHRSLSLPAAEKPAGGGGRKQFSRKIAKRRIRFQRQGRGWPGFRVRARCAVSPGHDEIYSTVIARFRRAIQRKTVGGRFRMPACAGA